MNKSEYAKLPWSMEDTIENLKEIKEMIQKTVIIKNLHGRGEKDAEEVAFDFDRAINALKKQIPMKATNIKECYVPESYEVDCISCKCPVCGTSFVSGDGDDFYCYKCGQLIVFD